MGRIKTLIDPVLTQAGYVEVADRAYRAKWSSPDVEHFVFVSTHLKGAHSTISGHYGIRNPCAEAFSARSIRAYGGIAFDTWKHDPFTSCTMMFAFSRIDAAGWPVKFNAPQLHEHMQGFIVGKLLPQVRPIATKEQLLALLYDDRLPFPWVGTNGAIRTAQIVALSGQCGKDWSEVTVALKDRLIWIANGLSKTSSMRSDPAKYLATVIEDWQRGTEQP